MRYFCYGSLHCLLFGVGFTVIHYPKLRNMTHVLSLGVFIAFTSKELSYFHLMPSSRFVCGKLYTLLGGGSSSFRKSFIMLL